MESNSQEKKNLMQDMPIDRIAGGGGSWMSKHSMSAGSPAHKGGSYKGSPAHQAEKPDPKTLINSDGKSQTDVMNSKRSDVDSFRNKIKDLKFNTQEQVDKANAIDLGNVNAFNKSNDSISRVNTNYNNKVKTYNDSINSANINIDSILGGDSPANQVAAEGIEVDDHPSASNASGESQRDVISRVNSEAQKKAMLANSTIERNNALIDSLSGDSKMKMNAYDKANLQRVKSTDSIRGVNKVTFKQ